MTAFLQPHEGRIYAAFRIVVGFCFLQHGLQKCFGWLGGSQADSALMWVAGVLELVGGFAVMTGTFARWSAFVCSGLMAAAYFMAHASKGFWPVVNHGELAALYCWAFLFISVHGAGIWSVDDARGAS